MLSLPALACDDPKNGPVADTIFCRQLRAAIGRGATLVTSPDLADLLQRQLGIGAAFASYMSFGVKASAILVAIVRNLAALVVSIMRIVGMSTEPQMGRVDAGRCVAGMAHKHSFGDGAVVQLVRESVRPLTDALAVNHEAKNAIAGSVKCASPQPASVSGTPLDLRPEAGDSAMLRYPRLLMALEESSLGGANGLATAARTERQCGRIALHRKVTPFVAMPGGARNVAQASCCPNYTTLGSFLQPASKGVRYAYVG